MNRIVHFATACLLLSLLPACGGPQPEPPTEPLPDTGQVEGMERQMWADFQSRNFDDMLLHMTSDVVLLGPDGMIDRAVWRARMAQQECQFEENAEPEDVQTKVLAPTIVMLTYHATPVGTCDGEAAGPEVDSSVWVWQNGEWLATSHHWTAMAPESEE